MSKTIKMKPVTVQQLSAWLERRHPEQKLFIEGLTLIAEEDCHGDEAKTVIPPYEPEENVMGCPRCGHEWPEHEGPPCPECGC